jgi:uncharacterized damage-inducible protein DinB
MVERTPWIERRFRFELSVGAFPSVLARLRGTPARVEDLVRDADPTALTARRGDSWSIQENVGHLVDVESLWLGRLDDFDRGLDTLRPADMTNQRTHEANHNSRPLAEILQALRDSRAEMIARLEALDAAGIERTALHPRLEQPMRVLDLMVFVAEHDDHHLARIADLLRDPA